MWIEFLQAYRKVAVLNAMYTDRPTLSHRVHVSTYNLYQMAQNTAIRYKANIRNILSNLVNSYTIKYRYLRTVKYRLNYSTVSSKAKK